MIFGLRRHDNLHGIILLILLLILLHSSKAVEERQVARERVSAKEKLSKRKKQVPDVRGRLKKESCSSGTPQKSFFGVLVRSSAPRWSTRTWSRVRKRYGARSNRKWEGMKQLQFLRLALCRVNGGTCTNVSSLAQLVWPGCVWRFLGVRRLLSARLALLRVLQTADARGCSKPMQQACCWPTKI